MIQSLYQYVNKGSLRTLSFILAIVLTLVFFFNFNQFSTQLRTANPFLILFILWGLVILWIHGIGFKINRTFWQLIFFPYLGYLAFLFAIVEHYL
ncbi:MULTISPECIES: cyd operon protein YbgE [Rodentibacter]|uniref:cyd operon protein YbgE n=1 Tax=Rodentibacter TaxID=1960084 RepID=UPI001CFDD19D|nr:cyd operon protein YbgE [Rodentibacter sp. JRC1]GJI55294.1 cyd operon protein YbgE [Rodentibacter sp. JRC1]